MSSLRPAMRAFIIATCALAVVLLLAVAEVPDLQQLARAFLFGGVAAAAQLRPMYLSSGVKVTAEEAATFAAALTLGPFLSAIVAGGSTLAAFRTSRGQSAPLGFFNTATSTLGTGAAAVVFATLAPAGLSADSALPVLTAAVVKYAVQAVLVDLAVALHLHRSPLTSWWTIHRRDLGPHAGLFALGILAAVLSMSASWLLLLFLVPAALLLRVLAEGARLPARAREAVFDLADRVDARDPYTRDHSKRTADLAEQIARWMGLEQSQVELIRLAARVHDIGKVGINEDVLLKRGALAPSESLEVRRHVDIGAKLLCRYPDFWEGAVIVLAHHERPDGAGYPRGLSRSQLPLEAAVVAVADSYDAMTNDRPHRRAMSWSQAREAFVRGSDAQWDARAAAALVRLMDEQQEAAVASRAHRRSAALAVH